MGPVFSGLAGAETTPRSKLLASTQELCSPSTSALAPGLGPTSCPAHLLRGLETHIPDCEALGPTFLGDGGEQRTAEPGK